MSSHVSWFISLFCYRASNFPRSAFSPWCISSQNQQNAADPLPGEVTGDSNETHSHGPLCTPAGRRGPGLEKEKGTLSLSMTAASPLMLCFSLVRPTGPVWGLLKLHNRFTAWQIHLTLHYTTGALACCLQTDSGREKWHKVRWPRPKTQPTQK